MKKETPKKKTVKKAAKKKTVKKAVKKTVKKAVKKTVKKDVKKTVKKAVKKTVKKITKKIDKNEAVVEFQIQADAGSEVYVAGSFNAWDPSAHKLSIIEDIYTISIVLSKGRHEYKFIINGVWCVDPNCGEWQPNSMGSINSLLTVE